MTSKYQWQIKSFSNLTNNELYDALKLRVDVFVVEQTCYYPDLDDQDRHPNTLHLLCYDHLSTEQKSIAAYLRVLPKGQTYDDYISIGRVATSQHYRGKGLGHVLIQKALAACQQYFPNEIIKISAQEHLEKFYQQYGFITVSDMYLEDNIPHISMIKNDRI